MAYNRRIAYLRISDFGTAVARIVDPSLGDLPARQALILLDDAGRVLSADAPAAAAGVIQGQTERQAVARCPAALFRPALEYPIYETQSAVLERVARYSGRWQPVGLGAAYLDATGLPGDLIDWCQGLAEEVRALRLIPSIGLTNGKFGASAAGEAAAPHHMLILTPAIQPDFLAQQPSVLLPLEPDALLQLRHLGIRTLGQYARLPSAGVLARWGEAGRTAQRWAQGEDDRPVVPPSEHPEVSGHIEFDAPLADREILLNAIMRKTDRLLKPIRGRLQAVGWLSLTVTRGDRRVLLPVQHTFAMPTAAPGPIRLAFEKLLGRVAWEGEGAWDIVVALGDITDAPAQQLSLLDEPTPREKLAATLAQLAARYGRDTFCMASLTEPDHPLPERRVSWQQFE
jgi:nucleotidyltransferase/DNA polymerase involved in DNA repair